MQHTTLEKLTILADRCQIRCSLYLQRRIRRAAPGTLGGCYAPGAATLTTQTAGASACSKVLLTNRCAFDCSYCVNRRSNDCRASFEPRELAELTIEFYRRNYIEGLFYPVPCWAPRTLPPSGCWRSCVCCGARPLWRVHPRQDHPGASPELLQQMGYLADRLSVNIELPSEKQSLRLLAPDKAAAPFCAP